MTRSRLLWQGEVRPRDSLVSTLSGNEWELALALEAQRTAGHLAAALADQSEDSRRLAGRLAALARHLHPEAPAESLTGEVLHESNPVLGVRLATGHAPSLWDLLHPLLVEAQQLDVVVAYASPGGVRLLGDWLDRLRAADSPVRILVGNYLGGTQPDGLAALLRHCGGSVRARFEANPNVHFHPKVYRVVDGHRHQHLAVGSSNLSYAALTGQRSIGGAVEWSVIVDDGASQDILRSARQRIDALWESHGQPLDEELVRRFRETHRQHLPPAGLLDEVTEVEPVITANAAQEEALRKLQEVRGRGDHRALVVAATGLGKTYLAALDSLQVAPRGSGGRVLFVAHRREILEQAKRAFEAIRGDGVCGFLHQDARDLRAHHLFASIFSLDDEALATLHDVKYVVIDEAHHSAAASYRKLLARLEPEFLLGLTATPERLDGNSIYELFDGVVAYEKTLLGAIEAGWLVPFHYFGVPDPVDYRSLRRTRGRYGYDEAELSAAVRSPERQQAALRWIGDPRMPGTRTLLFCIDIAHAEDTAAALRALGQRVALVHSGPGSDDRAAAIDRLRDGTLDSIVSVDMLSEGVDVPAVDRVVLLRPTESPTVFLQQIGRGLRRLDGKSHLNVIDLVGNHFRARLHMQLLGVNERAFARVPAGEVFRQEHSDGRLLWLAPEAIAAINAVSRSVGSVARRVEEALELLAARPGNERPRLRDVLAMTGYAVSTLRDKFGSWFGVLQQFARATSDDAALDGEPAVRRLCDALETTDMSGPHKMFVLLALARLGRTSAAAAELAPIVIHLASREHPFVGQAMEKRALESPRAMETNLVKNPFDRLSRSHPEVFLAKGNTITLDVGDASALTGFWDAVVERAEAKLLEFKRKRSFGGEVVGRIIPEGRGITLMLGDEAARLAPAGSDITLLHAGRRYGARVAKVAINVVWDEGDPERRNIAGQLYSEVAGAEEGRLAWRTYVRLWKREEAVVEMELA